MSRCEERQFLGRGKGGLAVFHPGRTKGFAALRSEVVQSSKPYTLTTLHCSIGPTFLRVPNLNP